MRRRRPLRASDSPLRRPDLIVLSLGVPDRPGLEVCTALREFAHAPSWCWRAGSRRGEGGAPGRRRRRATSTKAPSPQVELQAHVSEPSSPRRSRRPARGDQAAEPRIEARRLAVDLGAHTLPCRRRRRPPDAEPSRGPAQGARRAGRGASWLIANSSSRCWRGRTAGDAQTVPHCVRRAPATGRSRRTPCSRVTSSPSPASGIAYELMSAGGRGTVWPLPSRAGSSPSALRRALAAVVGLLLCSGTRSASLHVALVLLLVVLCRTRRASVRRLCARRRIVPRVQLAVPPPYRDFHVADALDWLVLRRGVPRHEPQSQRQLLPPREGREARRGRTGRRSGAAQGRLARLSVARPAHAHHDNQRRWHTISARSANAVVSSSIEPGCDRLDPPSRTCSTLTPLGGGAPDHVRPD